MKLVLSVTEPQARQACSLLIAQRHAKCGELLLDLLTEPLEERHPLRNPLAAHLFTHDPVSSADDMSLSPAARWKRQTLPPRKQGGRVGRPRGLERMPCLGADDYDQHKRDIRHETEHEHG